MASGSFTGTTSNKYITAKVNWSSTPDIVKNQSTVTATLMYSKSSSSNAATYGTGVFALSINGVSTSTEKRITLNPDNSWVTIGSATVIVPHNADGSRSVQIVATGGIPGLSFSSTSCSATVILDKIARASTPAFTASSFTIGGSIGIALYPADSTFRHTVTYSWGPLSGTIGTNIASSITWTTPMDFCNYIPNGTQGTLYITAETFTSGGVSLGKVTKTVPGNVPASVVPTISAVTLSDSGSSVPATWGVYVKGKSVLHAKVSAAGSYGSRIVGYSISALGVTVSSNDVDIGTITSSGSVNVNITVTDSRGRTANTTRSISVEDYAEPVVGHFTVERANNMGDPVDNGTYAKIKLIASGSAVSNKNTVTAKIYHMRSDVSTWSLARTISIAYSYDDIVMIANMVSSRSYAIKVEVSDAFGTSAAEAKLNAEGAVIGWLTGGIGVSFGKAAEEAYKADFDWEIHGRKGATFDGHVNVPTISVGGIEPLRTFDIVTVGRNSNLDITQSNAYVGIVMNQILYGAKLKLQLSSGGIAIPTGVRSVKVSAQVAMQVVTPGARFLHVQIVREGTYITISRTVKFYTSSVIPESMVISPIYISAIQPGDIIILGMYGQSGDVVYNTVYETFMTVEAYA